MAAEAQLDLATYLAALPSAVKRQVLSAPWTALALMRSLTPLAKQFCLRMLYVDTPVSRGAAARGVCRASS
jgi:hypothetical protein